MARQGVQLPEEAPMSDAQRKSAPERSAPLKDGAMRRAKTNFVWRRSAPSNTTFSPKSWKKAMPATRQPLKSEAAMFTS